MRETESKAWDAANDLIRYVDEDAIAKTQEAYARMDSEGQRQMQKLHKGNRNALEISPNLWAGMLPVAVWEEQPNCYFSYIAKVEVPQRVY